MAERGDRRTQNLPNLSPAAAAEPSPARQCRESHEPKDECRQGRQNSRHPVARQDFRQFLAETTLLTVFLLVKNVIHRGTGLRNAHAEGGISFLRQVNNAYPKLEFASKFFRPWRSGESGFEPPGPLAVADLCYYIDSKLWDANNSRRRTSPPQPGDAAWRLFRARLIAAIKNSASFSNEKKTADGLPRCQNCRASWPMGQPRKMRK